MNPIGTCGKCSRPIMLDLAREARCACGVAIPAEFFRPIPPWGFRASDGPNGSAQAVVADATTDKVA